MLKRYADKRSRKAPLEQRHDHSRGRLDRPTQRRRPWRDRQPAGEEDGGALGRASRLDGRPCHRRRGSRPSLRAAPSDADTPHSHFAATSRPYLARPQPPDLRLAVNPLEILKTAKVVHGAGSVERRHADPADPQTAQFERVAAATEVQRATADGTAADKRDLHLVDIDAARRFRGSRGLGACAGREKGAQDHQAHSKPSDESLLTESTEHLRSPCAQIASFYFQVSKKPISPGIPPRVFEHLGLQPEAERPQVICWPGRCASTASRPPLKRHAAPTELTGDRGTDGSNPSPSSKESATNLTGKIEPALARNRRFESVSLRHLPTQKENLAGGVAGDAPHVTAKFRAQHSA